MRRVSKRRPPVNVRPEDQQACTLSRAERDYCAVLLIAPDKTECARSHFDQLDKVKLRKAMYREQGSICIYCESRVKEWHPEPPIDHESPIKEKRQPPIDHWRPLSLSPQQALCWRNMHLSCTFRGTCDDIKGERPLKWNPTDPDLPWPSAFTYENVIGFTSFGEMYVRRDRGMNNATRTALELAIADRGTQKTLLNLNHPTLMKNRRDAIDEEREKLNWAFPGRTASPADRKNRADALLAANPLLPFVSIRVAWLLDTLGDGK